MSALAALAADREVKPAALSVSVGEAMGPVVPEIGFEVGALDPIVGTALPSVRALRPSHLRVDLELDEPGWAARLDQALNVVDAVGCGLEIGLLWSRDLVPSVLADLSRRLPSGGIVQRALLIGNRVSLVPSERAIAIRAALRSIVPGLSVLLASPAHFAMLNREWPPTQGIDGVAYSIQAQVHASDDLSLIESLEGEAHTVRAADGRFSGRVVVSPIAMGPGGPDAPRDPRWPSLFGAGWTLGSVAALGRARSLTYRGLLGLGGVLEVDGTAVRVLPVFHVFSALLGWRGVHTRAIRISGDLPAAALAVKRDSGTGLLVANLSSRRVSMSISGLDAGPAALRVLDAASAIDACVEPTSFAPRRCEIESPGTIVVDLQAFAIAFLDQLGP